MASARILLLYDYRKATGRRWGLSLMRIDQANPTHWSCMVTFLPASQTDRMGTQEGPLLLARVFEDSAYRRYGRNVMRFVPSRKSAERFGFLSTKALSVKRLSTQKEGLRDTDWMSWLIRTGLKSELVLKIGCVPDNWWKWATWLKSLENVRKVCYMIKELQKKHLFQLTFASLPGSWLDKLYKSQLQILAQALSHSLTLILPVMVRKSLV